MKKRINTNVIISVILITLIMFGLKMLVKYDKNNVISIAETYIKSENENTINSKDLIITSRYDIDRIQNNEMSEYVEISSDDLLEEYIEYSHDKIIEPNNTIQNITISKDMDITVRTGLSKESFKELISNVKADTSGFFYENSDLIYDVCEKYSLNEIFFCGLISAESGWDIASYHRRTYNYISLMKNGSLIQFNSVEDGLECAAKTLHNNYLSEGGCFYYGNTLSAMQTKFCPGSSTWVNLVYGRMEQLI